MSVKKKDKPSIITDLNEKVADIKSQVVDKEKTVRRGAMEI
jgi:predicted amino acid-binding ACT domain protein